LTTKPSAKLTRMAVSQTASLKISLLFAITYIGLLDGLAGQWVWRSRHSKTFFATWEKLCHSLPTGFTGTCLRSRALLEVEFPKKLTK